MESGFTPMNDTDLALQNALKRIDALELQVAELRGIRLVRESSSLKPVNRAAYQKALDAFVAGDRKAIREYLRHYRVPGTSGDTAMNKISASHTKGKRI